MYQPNPNPKDFTLSTGLLVALAIILGILLMSGCTTSRSVNKWLDNRPAEQTQPVVSRYLKLNELYAATFCDVSYPIRETTETRVDTLKIPITIQGDSIPCPPVTDIKTGVTYTPKVKCPDVSYYQTSITRLEQTTKESSAKAERYRLEGEEKDKENLRLQKELTVETKAHTETDKDRDRWRLWFIILLGLNGLFFGLKIARII